MGALQYARGLAIGFALILLAILGMIFLGIVQIIAELGMLVLLIIFAIAALLVLPHYLGEKKKIKSKGYSLKKVKD